MASHRRDIAPIRRTHDTTGIGTPPTVAASAPEAFAEPRPREVSETEENIDNRLVDGFMSEDIATAYKETIDSATREQQETIAADPGGTAVSRQAHRALKGSGLTEDDEPTPVEVDRPNLRQAEEAPGQAEVDAVNFGEGPRSGYPSPGIENKVQVPGQEAPLKVTPDEGTEDEDEEDQGIIEAEDIPVAVTTEEANPNAGDSEGDGSGDSEQTSGDDETEQAQVEEANDLPEGTLDTVKKAKAYIDEAEGDERKARAEAVLAAEKDGENRSTLIDHAEGAINAESDSDEN